MGWSYFLEFLDRRAVPLACVAAVLLALPGVRSPLLLDDVVHRAMLEDRLPGARWSSLELYDFVGAPERPATVLRDHGSVPWFTADDLKLRFVRPLSSALLAVLVLGALNAAARQECVVPPGLGAWNAPLRVRFDSGTPLSSPGLCFLQWRDGHLRVLDLAGRTQVDLPHEPGPLGW
jgi:hypothetical protein